MNYNLGYLYNYKNLSLGVLFFILVGQINAQIFPPNPLCVKNDTIFWENPNNTCGDFISYDLFVSKTLTGTFVLVDNIVDENKTDFFHTNTSNETRFYYMQTKAECLGEMSISSDTISNEIPVSPSWLGLTVENGKVKLSWKEDETGKIEKYFLYNYINENFDVAAEILGSTYIDLNSNPGTQTNYYKIGAVDYCGNLSLLTDFHQTIFLEGFVGDCKDKVNLKWNPYSKWDNLVEKQRIWMVFNGETEKLIAELDGLQNQFTFTEIINSGLYEFYIENIESNTGTVSKSNVISINITIDERHPVFLTNLDNSIDTELKIEWIWNPNSLFSEYSIVKLGENKAVLLKEEKPNLPSESNSKVLSIDSDDPNIYQIQTHYSCNNGTASNQLKSMKLEVGLRNDKELMLNWSPFYADSSELVEFKLYKNNSNIPIWKGGDNAFLYKRNVLDKEECFYVVANGQLKAPFDYEVSITSNIVCFTPTFDIYFPNALKYGGQSAFFRPKSKYFKQIENYQLLVYNRWGTLVFETNNFSDGWDGTNNGKSIPSGNYIYKAAIKLINGKELTKNGTILLMK